MSFVRALRFDAIFRDFVWYSSILPSPDEHHLYRAFQSTHSVFADGGENAAIISGILQEFSPIESAHRVYLVISLISLLIVESLPVTAPAIRYCDPINFALIITQRLCVCTFFLFDYTHITRRSVLRCLKHTNVFRYFSPPSLLNITANMSILRMQTYIVSRLTRAFDRIEERIKGLKTRVEQRRAHHTESMCDPTIQWRRRSSISNAFVMMK